MPHAEVVVCQPPLVNMGQGWSGLTRQESRERHFPVLLTLPYHILVDDKWFLVAGNQTNQFYSHRDEENPSSTWASQ